jgi:hypothetical protein
MYRLAIDGFILVLESSDFDPIRRFGTFTGVVSDTRATELVNWWDRVKETNKKIPRVTVSSDEQTHVLSGVSPCFCEVHESAGSNNVVVGLRFDEVHVAESGFLLQVQSLVIENIDPPKPGQSYFVVHDKGSITIGRSVIQFDPGILLAEQVRDALKARHIPVRLEGGLVAISLSEIGSGGSFQPQHKNQFLLEFPPAAMVFGDVKPQHPDKLAPLTVHSFAYDLIAKECEIVMRDFIDTDFCVAEWIHSCSKAALPFLGLVTLSPDGSTSRVMTFKNLKIKRHTSDLSYESSAPVMHGATFDFETVEFVGPKEDFADGPTVMTLGIGTEQAIADPKNWAPGSLVQDVLAKAAADAEGK